MTSVKYTLKFFINFVGILSVLVCSLAFSYYLST